MDMLLVWGLGLLAVAFLLMVVDIFLPTMGVLSVTSLLVAIAGVVCLYKYQTIWGVAGTLVVVVGAPVIFFLGLQVMPNTPIGRKLIPPMPGEGDDDAPPPRGSPLEAMIGQEGVVITDLRPIGTVRIGDARYDAMSEIGLARAGTPIRVIGYEGSELRVRPV